MGGAVRSIPYVSGDQVLVARRSSRVTTDKDETAICPMDKNGMSAALELI